MINNLIPAIIIALSILAAAYITRYVTPFPILVPLEMPKIENIYKSA